LRIKNFFSSSISGAPTGIVSLNDFRSTSGPALHRERPMNVDPSREGGVISAEDRAHQRSITVWFDNAEGVLGRRHGRTLAGQHALSNWG
jgi:hypothetical protein